MENKQWLVLNGVKRHIDGARASAIIIALKNASINCGRICPPRKVRNEQRIYLEQKMHYNCFLIFDIRNLR